MSSESAEATRERSGLLALLLAELRAWRAEGVIDEETHQRILLRYRPGEPAAATSPPRASLEVELETQARALPANEPAADPEDLDQELAREAAAHLALEAEVAGARAAEAGRIEAAVASEVSERPARLGPAVMAAACDVASLAPPDPPPAPAEAVLRRESLWPSRIRPFLFANALWLAGGVLILFGSLYFLRLIWDDLSSLSHQAVIATALHLYAAGFFGAGYLLARRRQAHLVARILFCFTVAILPLGSVALGELAALQLRGGGPLMAVLASCSVLLGLGLQAFLLVVIGGLFERACARPLLQGSLGIALLTTSVASLEQVLPPSLSLLPQLALPLGFLLLARALLGLCRERVLLRQSLLLCGGGLLWSLLVLAVRVEVAAPIAFTHLSTLCVAVAALLLACDHRLRVAAGQPARLTPLAILLHGGLLLGLLLSIVGLVKLGYFDLGARLTVLASSAIALYTLACSARRHGRGAFTHLAAGTGLLTYFFLPAPFAGLLMLAQRWVSSALGYAHEPLPPAYYGLTFVPYLLLVAALALVLRRRRADLSMDLQRFLMGIGALLTGLALASRGDLRPMLWTFPLYAAGAYLGARAFARPGLLEAGHGLVLGTLWVLGLHLEPHAGWPLSAPLLLGALALCASIASLRWRPAPGGGKWTDAHLAHAGVAGIALSLCTLARQPLGPEQALVSVLLCSGGLAALTARFEHRVMGHLTAIGVLAAVVLANAVFANLGTAVSLPVSLLGLGLLATMVVHDGASAGPGSRRHRLIGQPATLLAACSLGLALIGGLDLLPRGFPILPAAVLAWLAISARGAACLPLAAAALAASLGTSAELVLPRSWPMVPSVLAAALVLAATHLPSPAPEKTRRRRLTVAVCAHALAALGLLASLQLASEAATDAQRYLWGFLAALGASLFLGALTFTHRRTSPGAFALGGLALSSSAGALLLLRATVDPASHGLWAYGSLAALLAAGWLGLRALFVEEKLRRIALAAATLLALLPLLEQSAQLLLTLLRCQATGDFVMRMVSLAPGGWAGLCAACALGAALLLGRLHPGWASQQILLGAVLGTALALEGWLAPEAHLTVVLGGTAVALAAWPRGREGRTDVPLAWPLAVAGLALLASHLHLREPGPLLAGAASTLSLFLLARASRGRACAHPLSCAWSLALVGTSQLLAVWLAATFSTGRHPAASACALMGLLALLTGLLLDRLDAARDRSARRSLAPAASVGLLLAGFLAVAAVVGCQPRPPTFVVALSLLLLPGLAAQLAWMGRRDEREWPLHLALLAVGIAYLIARAETSLAGVGLWLDGATVLVGAELALALGRAQAAGRVARRPLLVAAGAWPAIGALLLLGRLSTGGAALLAMLVAFHYGIMGRQLRSRHLAIPGLLFATSSLLLAFTSLGWSNRLLWSAPVTLTLLVLTHLYGDELGRAGASALRSALLLALYTLGVAEALTAVTPLEGLVVVPGLCVAAMVAGTLLRVRAYVVMGIAFLFADLLLNMARYGLASRPLGALFLTLLGILIVTAMVVFTLERERILRRYSTILGELRTWD